MTQHFWNWWALQPLYLSINFDCAINYLCITIIYELCIMKYSRIVSLFIDTYIIQNEWHFGNFFRFLETMFIKVNVWDLVRKIIKSRKMFHLKKLTIFKTKKKNEEVKMNLYSTYHITLIFHQLQSLLTSNTWLFFSYLCYLMKCSTSHCVKSVRIPSYSGPHFPAYGLITEKYGVSFCIQSECGKGGSE